MKNVKKNFIVALIFSLALPLAAMAKTITLRADVWCPYNCEQASTHPGYIVEATHLIFKRAGHRVEYKTLNWSRTIREVGLGQFDGAIGASKDEAPNFIFPEEEQGLARVTFWKKEGFDWVYDGTKSLKSIFVGLSTDYSQGKEIDDIAKTKPRNFHFVTGDDPVRQNIRMLLAGRVDVILAETNVLQYVAKTMKVDANLVHAGGEKKYTTSQPIYIAFSPRRPESKIYAKILSDGWKAIRKSGELKKILERYGIEDWK